VSDFTSEFWAYYIGIITFLSIVACGVLLKSMTTRRLAPGEQPGTMGHVWDGDLQEYNHPLPRWWIFLFWITLAFGVAYVALYPGMGSYAGVWHWNSTGQFEDEQKAAQEKFGPIYEKYAKMDLRSVAADAEARETGQHLFLTYCSQCHASDAHGSKGFPNLADKDWLYGGDPETIKASILNGRNAAMPAFGPVLGEDGVKNVAHYVMSLSGLTHDGLRASVGKDIFAKNCAVCHTSEGTGNPLFGAPNLTDKIWLYGGGESTIIETITKGRNGRMPAWGPFLGEAKAHILAAYVWSLSNAK
jgi:cytochrome c oxidase cbb3-type subunit III